MICKKCGAEIKAGNIYCSHCGQEVQMVPDFNVLDDLSIDLSDEPGMEKKTVSAPVQKQPEKHNNWVWIAAALVSFVLLLCLGFFSKQMSGSQKNAADQTYVQALSAIGQNDYEQAINCFQRMLIDQPDDENLSFWIAYLYDLMQDNESEISTLEKIWNQDPTNVYACEKLAELYAKDQKYEELNAFLDQISDPKLLDRLASYLVPEPVISDPPANVKPGDTLTITADADLNIYYTMDGSSPIDNGKLYYSPIPLTEGDYTIQAVACNEAGSYSRIVAKDISVDTFYELPMPSVTPNSGNYAQPEQIFIDVPSGCQAYYTWDGSMPSATSTLYTSQGIEMPVGNNVLSVILIDEYGNVSSVMRCNYIYMPDTVEDPGADTDDAAASVEQPEEDDLVTVE